ncbi:MAG: type restriction enzyme [Pseudomonadota bacterium]|nr:type restriction enzyme [Pseudomonadota bacterium]
MPRRFAPRNDGLISVSLKTFSDVLDVDRIAMQPSFVLPESITPSANASALPKSLYVAEAAMGYLEGRVINDVASLDNVQWWSTSS